jgi:hydroxyquinol 1,2-dioxygenase
MRDFDEHNITQAVIDRFANTPDPRLKQIMTSLVTHLHDFIRDVEPSFAEWEAAIKFLTRTGQICNGADISGGQPGELLFVEAKITAAGGAKLPGAVVDVWQSDDDGFYDVQRTDLSGAALRGQFRADESAKIWFRTIQPAPYPIPYDGPVGDMLTATNRHPWRPAHVHFMISAPGYETLVTHVFSAGDQYLDSDAVFGVKNSLIRKFTSHPPGTLPDGTHSTVPWRYLSYDFGLKPLAQQQAA